MKHKTEDTPHPILNIALTTKCLIGYAGVRRLSILSWNPGPRRGKDGAMERHIAVKWHIIALQEAIEYIQHEYIDESFSCNSLCWLCCLVEQGQLSLGHQSYFRLPPRHQRWAAASRERRTIRIGPTSCHLPCIIPKANAQRQIILHHDVVTHQQPQCEETRCGK